ncbi:water chloroplastic [Micractinium conductrix]|uniref:Water chloroplastic n=1 Tax=Micractinium conductrix TaxID=554055 RepID=A0A2P6VGV2_9CHLO|nr:water chloroplastic [Micractinium conductrix]|eukprot:PSC73322.1 water chloroplastic [Micractinium conductrix]
MLLAASSAAVSGSRALGSAPKAGSALGGSRGAGALRRVSYAAGARAAPSRRSPTFRAAVVAVQEYHSEAASGVAVTFTLIDKKVDFGEQVVLVGNTPELGNWQLDHAPNMTWSEGDTWVATITLPPGTHVEYKFVLRSPTTSPVWEKCDNRRFTVDTGSIGTLATDWDVAEHTIAPPAFDTALSNGRAAAAAALDAAAAAMEAKDRAQALAAVQEAANAAAAVVAAAEATAAAVKRAVQAAEALVAELDAPTSNGTYNTAALKGPGSPAAAAQAAAAQAAADARYSSEQLEFMRRKLDDIQAMPSASRNGSRSPSPRPAARSASPAAVRRASPSPAAARRASPSPAPASSAGGPQYTPEQLAFLQRSGKSPSPKPPTSRPQSSKPVSAVYAKNVTSYSPEQLEFLRRSGKL